MAGSEHEYKHRVSSAEPNSLVLVQNTCEPRRGSDAPRMTPRARKDATPREPFFRPLPLVLVGLFAFNNLWLKGHHPTWLSGKLSDATAAFFMPLYLAAMMRFLAPAAYMARVLLGALATAALFLAVKTSSNASDMLNSAITAIARPLQLSFYPNHVDYTDLAALPIIGLAIAYCARTCSQGEQHGE